jgi:hypothetical protein
LAVHQPPHDNSLAERADEYREWLLFQKEISDNSERSWRLFSLLCALAISKHYLPYSIRMSWCMRTLRERRVRRERYAVPRTGPEVQSRFHRLHVLCKQL